MKKWLTLLLASTLMLTACGKSNEKASLEKSINQLEKENKDLKKQKKDLQTQKDKLKDKQDRLQKDIDELPAEDTSCLLYTSPSPRDVEESRMPSSA